MCCLHVHGVALLATRLLVRGIVLHPLTRLLSSGQGWAKAVLDIAPLLGQVLQRGVFLNHRSLQMRAEVCW